MFARNGRSGYVLKPVNLRVKNKEAQNTAESRELHIRVRPYSFSLPFTCEATS